MMLYTHSPNIAIFAKPAQSRDFRKTSARSKKAATQIATWLTNVIQYPFQPRDTWVGFGTREIPAVPFLDGHNMDS